MSNFSIFSVLGIEIEYMLVDRDNLNIQPKSDLILSALAGHQADEVELGDIAISNELVMHVLELKNNGPRAVDAPVTEQFHKTIRELQPLLEQHNLLLLPTGAHPWMNPHTETVRWPHGNREIYKQFDAIFDCKGHGWSNLQSMHVNLPYANQEEFYQLHNVIRLILPLLPAIAASTPILDGHATGLLDSRLYFYSRNQQRIPSICGDVIPEFISSEEEYQQKILNPMYQDISPYDPAGILQYQWLNSRAAIPKFNSKAIEIRILDSQECVEADIAIAHAIHAVLKNWQSSSHYYLDNPCDTSRLKHIFDKAIEQGFNTQVEDMELLKQWQLPARSMKLNEVWSMLIEQVSSELTAKQQSALELILSQGNLSQRILNAVSKDNDKDSLKRIYRQLADCLLSNQPFRP
ncbi:carboxylate-amine ligase [Legionella bononiensis]|uniref:Glutamate--cysteine ligase n=1 Tax=Legionella bononiensis TaxID=2793102 RepID=A0ABS1W9A4_9GAMM|nr:glutamate-cysteine ligase family protein [Legionella bononiensis]MBL7480872.1 glutamate--cysteine ligase [Legionella bononiensis]MBL7525946.1 glutamate--cysteine ligase [Legionella bononiensis]MBL7563987.1 glutamate--cysteine ligase [Legionella bononiensis]